MMAEGEQGMTQQAFGMITVGDDYLKTMGLELIDGRDFAPGDADAERNFIVNEAAAKLMGWNDKAVGKKLRFFHVYRRDQESDWGCKGFQLQLTSHNIQPMIINRAREQGGGFLHFENCLVAIFRRP